VTDDRVEPQLVKRRPWTTWPFYALTVLGAVLTVFVIVQANQSDWRRTHDWPWNVRLPDPAVPAALFAASLGWVLLRDQKALSVKPLLRYTSEWVDVTGTTSSRQVVLAVGGQGSAVFRSVVWRVGLGGGSSVEEITTLAEVNARLAGLGLTEGTDYAFANVGRGASMDPGETLLYFWCSRAALGKFAVFETTFEFDSMMGDRFRRVVWLLPHDSAPSRPASIGPDTSV
jgi:hypothetical protein